MKTIIKSFVERDYTKAKIMGLVSVVALLIGTIVTGVAFALSTYDNKIEARINEIHDNLTVIDKELYRSNTKLNLLIEDKKELEKKIGLVENHIKDQTSKYSGLEKELNNLTKKAGL